jgi:hypothetical protein
VAVGIELVEVGIAGGEVIGCEITLVVSSLQPQKKPGVWHSTEVGEGVTGDVGSLQPHHPGVLQVVEEFEDVVDVRVGIETEVLILAEEVVFSSLHPNHPGVLQVDVEVVVVEVLVAVPVVVVVSSRHPHQPGVWHVDVRVLVFVEVDGGDGVVLLLLPVTSFHKGQS